MKVKCFKGKLLNLLYMVFFLFIIYWFILMIYGVYDLIYGDIVTENYVVEESLNNNIKEILFLSVKKDQGFYRETEEFKFKVIFNEERLNPAYFIINRHENSYNLKKFHFEDGAFEIEYKKSEKYINKRELEVYYYFEEIMKHANEAYKERKQTLKELESKEIKLNIQD